MAILTEGKPKRKLTQLNPYVLVILSFVLVIFVGSLLLCMPFSQKSGHWGNYMDALFSATSATCVTGLCTYAEGIGNQLTFFGQLVMLIMIQLGGLGFITVLTFFITLFKSKLQFRNRYMLSQMVGSTNFADVVKFVRKLILISFIAEILDMSPNFIGMIERGERNTTVENVFRIARALNVKPSNLFEEL